MVIWFPSPQLTSRVLQRHQQHVYHAGRRTSPAQGIQKSTSQTLTGLADLFPRWVSLIFLRAFPLGLKRKAYQWVNQTIRGGIRFVLLFCCPLARKGIGYLKRIVNKLFAAGRAFFLGKSRKRWCAEKLFLLELNWMNHRARVWDQGQHASTCFLLGYERQDGINVPNQMRAIVVK